MKYKNIKSQCGRRCKSQSSLEDPGSSSVFSLLAVSPDRELTEPECDRQDRQLGQQVENITAAELQADLDR